MLISTRISLMIAVRRSSIIRCGKLTTMMIMIFHRGIVIILEEFIRIDRAIRIASVVVLTAPLPIVTMIIIMILSLMLLVMLLMMIRTVSIRVSFSCFSLRRDLLLSLELQKLLALSPLDVRQDDRARPRRHHLQLLDHDWVDVARAGAAQIRGHVVGQRSRRRENGQRRVDGGGLRSLGLGLGATCSSRCRR